MKMHPRVLSTNTLVNNDVVNEDGENLGKVEDIVIDVEQSRVAYVVLSVGGFLGMRNKYTAIPWEVLKLSHNQKKVVLNLDKELLKKAPSFDKDNWPDMADPIWVEELHRRLGLKPYRDESNTEINPSE